MKLRWRKDSEFDEEIQAHLDCEIQANLERGMAPEEARAAALRKFGNRTCVKERAREADPLFWVESAARDLRFGVRNLSRSPGFTAVAVLSLALGIGANSAAFSFVDGLLLRPLDVPRDGELVVVTATAPQYRFGSFSYAEYSTYRDQARTLAGLLAEQNQSFAIQPDDNSQTRYVRGKLISGNFFDVLEVQPQLGRGFRPDEDSQAAKEITVVISDECWRDKFNSAPGTVGAHIRLNGQPAAIVGVLPPGFRGTEGFTLPEVYAPLSATPRLSPSNTLLTDSKRRDLRLFGRLNPGVDVRTAQAEFTALAEHVEKPFPKLDPQRTATVLPELTGRLQADPDDVRVVFIILAVAAMVLLLACSNVANMLLGRASARVKEITIRQSVGAGRVQLIAQLLIESFCLALTGAGVGLLLAVAAIRYFASIQIASDFPGAIPARLDLRVVAYTLVACMLAAVVSGLWPAIRATRVDLMSPTNETTPSRTGQRSRDALVVCQTALAAMLLISASLFIKSFLLARAANPGFRVDNVLTASFDPALAGYPEERIHAFYRDLLDRVRALPGVDSSTLGSHIPMGPDSQWDRVTPSGTSGTDGEPLSVMYDCVEPGYFAAMTTPILEGRAFDSGDRAGAPGVAIVNQELAQRFWPAGNTVGRQIRFGTGKRAVILEVVGVAQSGKYQETIDLPQPYVYLSFPQQFRSNMTLFVHTAADPLNLAPAIRREAHSLAADVPIYGIHSMRETFEAHGLLASRLMAQMVGAMGMIGLVLGVSGLYAVVAYSVARGTKEIGIRMALGATTGSVLRRVLASGVRLAFTGACIGAAAALGLTRYLREFLDRVNPQDPAAFLGVSILLLCVTLAACWIPARRATRVDPAITLHYE
jgi:predicted permease